MTTAAFACNAVLGIDEPVRAAEDAAVPPGPTDSGETADAVGPDPCAPAAWDLSALTAGTTGPTCNDGPGTTSKYFRFSLSGNLGLEFSVATSLQHLGITIELPDRSVVARLDPPAPDAAPTPIVLDAFFPAGSFVLGVHSADKGSFDLSARQLSPFEIPCLSLTTRWPWLVPGAFVDSIRLGATCGAGLQATEMYFSVAARQNATISVLTDFDKKAGMGELASFVVLFIDPLLGVPLSGERVDANSGKPTPDGSPPPPPYYVEYTSPIAATYGVDIGEPTMPPTMAPEGFITITYAER